jgi:hypothetical protein
MMKSYFLLIALIPALLPLILSGQADPGCTSCIVADTHKIDVRLFESDELLKITLRLDITNLKRYKAIERSVDAELTYYNSQNDSVTKKVELKSRGNVRRAICDFPPVSLNFRVKDSLGGIFNRIDKIKMVSYCKKGYQEEVLREYLVYKLYNSLTDYSFRVRLLEVTFINTHKKSKPIKEYCFLIEPLKLLEKRKKITEINSGRLTQRNVKPESMDRVAIFNFMIGNTDWSVPILHNIKIFSEYNGGGPSLGVAIPFDFDYSGLVDAEYAVPFEGLPIKSVREHFYLGMCRNKSDIENSLRDFSAKKAEFYRIIREFPYLKEKSKEQMISYLEEFYSRFDKKNNIINDVLSTCIEL